MNDIKTLDDLISAIEEYGDAKYDEGLFFDDGEGIRKAASDKADDIMDKIHAFLGGGFT